MHLNFSLDSLEQIRETFSPESPHRLRPGLQCLHTEISIKNIYVIEMKKYTRHPLNWKWIHPIKGL